MILPATPSSRIQHFSYSYPQPPPPFSCKSQFKCAMSFPCLASPTPRNVINFDTHLWVPGPGGFISSSPRAFPRVPPENLSSLVGFTCLGSVPPHQADLLALTSCRTASKPPWGHSAVFFSRFSKVRRLSPCSASYHLSFAYPMIPHPSLPPPSWCRAGLLMLLLSLLCVACGLSPGKFFPPSFLRLRSGM